MSGLGPGGAARLASSLQVHDQRHIQFNVIGSADMRVEVEPALQLAARDIVLLASDGLFDNLYIDEVGWA